MRIRQSLSVILPGLLLAACQPPPTDDSADRGAMIGPEEGIIDPIESPDVEGAIWSPTSEPGRLLYGKPGQTPLAALHCRTEDGVRTIEITRFVITDKDAKAIQVLIGNGHSERLPIEAVWNGRAWIWQATWPGTTSDLESLTGPREVEWTIPGAGSLILNPSPLPGRLIARCRGLSLPASMP